MRISGRSSAGFPLCPVHLGRTRGDAKVSLSATSQAQVRYPSRSNQSTLKNHKKKEGSPRRGLLPIAVGETERSDDEPTECPMPKGTPPTGTPIEKPADTSRHTPSARPRKKHLPLHRGKVEGLAWDESDRGREGDCRWK